MTDHRLAYSVSEAAKLVGIGRTSMYDLIARGEIRTCAIGRRRVVPVAEINALLDRLITEQHAS